ncbi:hypothetical protein BJV78DRAFT_1155553 [Lactifluus subvellereus]|nr:hypothetical protein BJV78DRAFT_1155553 [Lactifluus subvellereus]
MSFPDPVETPAAFVKYLKAANLDFGLVVFRHYQNQPGEASNSRMDESKATDWCKQMVTFLGELSRMMHGQPVHQSIFSICFRATNDIECRLAVQKEADAAAKRKREEEERARLEQERLATELKKRDRLEKSASWNIRTRSRLWSVTSR